MNINVDEQIAVEMVIKFKIMETDVSDLAQRKCVPCEGGTPPLKQDEIADLKRGISPEWHVVDNKKISRKFSFVNFRHTMAFVNDVARIAEEEGHHPVMHVNYGSCEIELWTHAIDGLSENDFILAAKIDRINI